MYFRRLYLTLLTLLVIASSASAQVQKAVPKDAPKDAGTWTEWETITPEGEEFTVTMPKNPTTETAKFPYHKMELNTRLYMAKSAGPVLAVASFSGIKSNPAEYTEFARFNSYIDAFKDFFPPKVRTKDTAVTRLTLVSSRPFHGHTGRSYKVSIGELNGMLHAFVTRKRFYAIVSLNTKKDDALEEKFLSSFVLPDRQPDPPKNAATAANQGEQPTGEQTIDGQPASAEQKQAQQQGDEGVTEAPKKEGTTGRGGGELNQPTPNADPNQKRAPVSGGMLNGKAIYLPKPELPAGVENGVVLVQILIDENGSVIDAKPVSGPQQLQNAAVAAARLARFMPTVLAGQPVQVSGTLSYNFVKVN